MAFHWSDNVHTSAFTPRDFEVELLAAANEKNLIICLGHNSSKEFIALKLIHELGKQLRNEHKKKKISLYITNTTDGISAYNLIYHLTDLKVINLNTIECFNDWNSLFDDFQVVILSRKSCDNALICSYIELEKVNLIVIEDCHKNFGNKKIQETLFEHYKKCEDQPRILGLAGPLHSAGCQPGRLGAELECLEEALNCKAETASDIVTVLRYCSKPIEIILQCAPPQTSELTDFLRNLVITKKNFINDHRFDPSEIYEGFQDEIKVIPDPKSDPINFLDEFLEILNELGPWCADRAALSLLFKIENCKVKTPYERHFLLLCLISTTLVQIRSHCDYIFQKIPTEQERIVMFSTPKVIRLIEILRLFKPDSSPLNTSRDDLLNDKCNNTTPRNIKILEKIDALDFNKLNVSIEETKEKIEKDATSEKTENIRKSLNRIIIDPNNKLKNEVKGNHHQSTPNFRSMKRHRLRNRTGGGLASGQIMSRYNYHNINHTDSDFLCGIIFCNSKFTAKILFALLCELRRNDTDLNYLNVQYTVDKVANPLVDVKEAETEHRKQEDVLKRFRMHECNLLIGTSVLEEGIDLPKCNLVIRWDPPVTYRSYVQCKGRARASHAYHIIMVAPTIKISNNYNELIETKIHKFACFPGNAYTYIQTTDDDDDEDYDDKDDNDTTSDDAFDKLTDTSILPEIEKTENNGKLENSFKDDDNIPIEQNKVVNTSVKYILENSNIIPDKSFEIKEIITNDFSTSQMLLSNNLNEPSFKCLTEIEDNFKDENENKIIFEKMEVTTNGMVEKLAQYMEIEKMLLRKCENSEPSDLEFKHADKFTSCIEDFKPLSNSLNGAFVNLSTAVGLINKYCAKLPSDTFTKLTPLWRCARTKRNNIDMYQCTLRLPINSPLKQDIIGLPMSTRILARRMAALIACKILHLSGELDDNLQPIGKEGFKASEPDWENFELEEIDEKIVYENSEPRPGTTKRRQYYYKRVASAFSDCRPNTKETSYLYHISMLLTCPIPEEQNTRGRKIYPPEESLQGFGILTTTKIPKVSSFPIFTRSGEVKVTLQLAKDNILLDEKQLNKIYTFINYTFTNVLRLQKYLMLFDPEATENCFFIVPTIRVNNSIEVDWNFLDIISLNIDKMPKTITDDERKNKEFDSNKFKDAVVMPWYRNQDQPQYFYVAEICSHLSPDSSFPGENYKTFQEYYYKKYNIKIQNSNQPLLDVDHTSARLNFLTPRYVNRKGVALPTSSEETKRAKRENLEQKQILVPELCTIHPFPASLWRAAVCLPCILYRINALLLADEIRKQVSYDLGLGKNDITETDVNFDWPTLDFGWSLADVLKKSRDAKLGVSDFENVKSDEGEDARREIELVTNNDTKMVENCENIIEKSNCKTANDILEEADRKLKSLCTMEIGIWSNEMAEDISVYDTIEKELWGLLPPNVNMCSRSNNEIRYGSPTSWNITTKNNIIENCFSDSDESYQSEEDECDTSSVYCNDVAKTGLRIEFKSDNVAEAIETEEEIIKREKQMAILNDRNSNETNYQNTKNIGIGYDCFIDNQEYITTNKNIKWHENEYELSIKQLQNDIKLSGMLIKYDQKLVIKNRKQLQKIQSTNVTLELLHELIPYTTIDIIENLLITMSTEKLTLDNVFYLNQLYMENNKMEKYIIEGSGDIFDNFNDSNLLNWKNKKEKEILIQFSETSSLSLKRERDNIPECINTDETLKELRMKPETEILNETNEIFSFDFQPYLYGHPGPSPSIILQALTMSNANDGINLERLETIGDSFLKYAITTYLYCTYENVHEGKLSHLRSKQVSNLNLYRLGRRKILGESMIATKFEPHDNWLPPCYYVPRELEKALIEAKIPACHWNLAELPNLKQLSSEQICKLVKQRAEILGLLEIDETDTNKLTENDIINNDNFPCFIPYNLVTQHSIPDKSVADCVEALIGAYLIECGPRGALLFMAWLGIRVLPLIEIKYNPTIRIPGSSRYYDKNNEQYQMVYGNWAAPKSPLLTFSPNPYEKLQYLLDGYSAFEIAIGYKFNDRAYLLQAMTHASYSPNRLTDCYQRLEFLGDAVLDYLITRHLYEDPRQHSPGALTDLRSALVNNTIFASLAVRHGFHKYFRHLSPALNEVIDRFVRIQHENGHSISEEFYLLSEEECDEAEDVEVPKALGDVFESVAGAIFLDSNMSLDTVWKVYSNMMRPEIEQFSNSVPKSPIRELLELEPETAKFGKPEKLADGRRVRVTVEVFGKGTFRGIGRNYRIAKCTAAKCALRQLKKHGLISRKH